MVKKKTDIHKPDNIFTKGKVVGHVGKDSRVRKRDGVFTKGEELGYVDEQNKVREKDGFFVKGKVVGQIKELCVYDTDGLLIPGQKWGYIDEEDNVRLRDSLFFKGRIIGQVRGKNYQGALAYFVFKFNQIEDQLKELEKEIEQSNDPVRLLGKVKWMNGWVPKAEALGDFDKVLKTLQKLESRLTHLQGKNRSEKRALCNKAKTLATTDDWAEGHSKFKELFQLFKNVGSVSKEEDEQFWTEFKTYQDRFYQRRKAFFEKRTSEQKSACLKKERLCEQARQLSTSSDWKATSQRYKVLRNQWKEAGFAGKDNENQLWQRFDNAQQQFYQRQNAFFAEKEKERAQNLLKKQQLCRQAEQASRSNHAYEAIETVKELQRQWKTIGHVPKQDQHTVWDRFNRACQTTFENYVRHKRQRMEDALHRKQAFIEQLEGFIQRDSDNIRRWEDAIARLRPGGREHEIRGSLNTKIANVTESMREKRNKIQDVQAEINDLKQKLRSLR